MARQPAAKADESPAVAPAELESSETGTAVPAKAAAPTLATLFVVVVAAPGRELGLVHLPDGAPEGSQDWLRPATATDLAVAAGRYRAGL